MGGALFLLAAGVGMGGGTGIVFIYAGIDFCVTMTNPHYRVSDTSPSYKVLDTSPSFRVDEV